MKDICFTWNDFLKTNHLILFVMDVPSVISLENSVISNSKFGWRASTFAVAKGFSYEISTYKTSDGKIRSSAQQIKDGGVKGAFRSASFSLFKDPSYDLIVSSTRATENAVSKQHSDCLEVFQAMVDKLPMKDNYVIGVGQMLKFVGYGDSSRVIYELVNDVYFWVDPDDLSMGQDTLSHLYSIEKQFGIGVYFLPNQIMMADELAKLVRDAREKIEREESERPAREAAAKIDRERAVEELLLEYPHLARIGGGATTAQVAKNIRLHLNKRFPNTRFSVRKEHHACINVSWTDGAAESEVEALLSMYNDHQSDVTGDFMDYSPQLFNEVFGGCKFIFSQREISKEVNEFVRAWAEEHLGESAKAYPDMVRGHVNDLLKDACLPCDGKIEVVRVVDGHGFCIKPLNSTKTDFEVMVVDKQPSEITLVKNDERNGIEITFANKPSAQILDSLKTIGFRWSKFQGIWWARYSDSLFKQVSDLLIL